MKHPIPTLTALLALLAGPVAVVTAAEPSIVREGETIRIKAAVLERVIRVSGGNVATDRLTVSGTALIDGSTGELAFRISRANPNRNPLELLSNSSAAAVNVAELLKH